MKIFLTGATGFIGSAVVDELITAGHQVVGLSRSAASDKLLADAGARSHRGDLEDIESIRRGAENADGVIHTAFNHDFSKFKENSETDGRVIRALGETLAGTDRPLIITSAIGLLPRDRVVTEKDTPVAGPNPRIASETAVDEVAQKGVRISVVRLPPSVHGIGDHAFVPTLIRIAREKRISVFEESGINCWPSVHRLDAANLFRLAVENNFTPGTRFHGVAEEGITFRGIAEAIGIGLNIPVVSKSKEEASAHFGSFAHFAAMDIRASSAHTREQLNWLPNQVGLIDDITANYFE